MVSTEYINDVLENGTPETHIMLLTNVTSIKNEFKQYINRYKFFLMRKNKYIIMILNQGLAMPGHIFDCHNVRRCATDI